MFLLLLLGDERIMRMKVHRWIEGLIGIFGEQQQRSNNAATAAATEAAEAAADLKISLKLNIQIVKEFQEKEKENE